MDKAKENFYQPKYWATWLVLGILKLLSRLSLRNQVYVGKLLGNLAYVLVPRRRKITEVNTRLCFSELSQAEQQQFVRSCIIQNAIGFVETARAWFGNPKSIDSQLEVEGLDNIREAQQLGKGVLVIGAHYTALDLGSVMVARALGSFYGMYRPQKNALMDKVMRESRLRYAQIIDRQDMRGIIRAIKSGHIVWYAPDQDYGRDVSVFAPFFGVDAATIKTTPKLAQINDSPVLLVSYHRKQDDSGYILRFGEPLDNFPTGDDIADATRINSELEKEIRRCPEQYMWVHRRFKTRPQGEKGFY